MSDPASRSVATVRSLRGRTVPAVSEQPEPDHVERLAKALEESRRIEKALNARDLEKDAQFTDRLVQRVAAPESEGSD